MNKEEIAMRLSYLKYLTTDNEDEIAINAAIEAVQKQKTSKWIALGITRTITGSIHSIVRQCSCCAHIYSTIESFKYCPHCGAKMEVEDVRKSN